MARSRGPGLIDNSAFRRSLEESRSALETFLKGHLWIESLLNSFLEAAAKHPAALRLDRASFSTKLNLCEAFGLLPTPVVDTLRLVNRRRNELAHDVAASLSEESVETLIAQSCEPIKSSFDRLMARREESVKASMLFRLSSWVMVLVNYLGYEVLLYEYRHDHEPQHVAFAAARLLDEQEGRTPRPDEEIRRLVGLPEPPDPVDIWVFDEPTGDAGQKSSASKSDY